MRRALPYLIWWSACLGAAWRSYYVVAPPDPSRTGTRAYGTNGEGAFMGLLPLFCVELLTVLALMRPRRRQISRRGYGLALGLTIIWTGVLVVGSMHQGPVYFWHLTWMLGMTIGVLAATVRRLLGR